MTSNNTAFLSGLKADMFILKYHEVAGPEISKDLQEHKCVLELDLKAGTAYLEMFRSASDAPGEPIGTFRASLSNELSKQIFKLVHSVGLADLPPPTGGGMATSAMTLTLENGQNTIEKVFTDEDIDLLERLDPLLQQLNQIITTLEKHPESAVKIDVKHARGKGDGRFKMIITNVGNQPVCIADPRTFGDEDPDRWAGVRFAELPEERPGYTSPPLEWFNLILPFQKAQEARIVLRPSKTFSALTDTWTAPRRNTRYIIQAVFSDYKGPGDANDGYPIRGVLFSEAIEITVK